MDNSTFKEQLLNLTSKMTEEEQSSLLSYALKLCEPHNPEQHSSHPHPY